VILLSFPVDAGTLYVWVDWEILFHQHFILESIQILLPLNESFAQLPEDLVVLIQYTDLPVDLRDGFIGIVLIPLEEEEPLLFLDPDVAGLHQGVEGSQGTSVGSLVCFEGVGNTDWTFKFSSCSNIPLAFRFRARDIPRAL